MAKVVLFGAGKIAEEVFGCLANDSPHEVVAFAVDGAFQRAERLFDRPVVAFETVQDRYPPDDFRMFVAVGYQDLNRFRAAKCAEARAKGYRLISYISSKAANVGRVPVGENTLVLEQAVIQTTARVGADVFVWSGNHIGHHAVVEDHCYVAGHVVIGGNTRVESHCFLGINATLSHEITVGRGSLIGAGALITKNVPPGSVHIAADTPRYRLDAESFLRLTKMK